MLRLARQRLKMALFEKNLGLNQARQRRAEHSRIQGVSKAKAGNKTGNNLIFKKDSISIHEGFKASFERFHTFKKKFLKAFFIGAVHHGRCDLDHGEAMGRGALPA